MESDEKRIKDVIPDLHAVFERLAENQLEKTRAWMRGKRDPDGSGGGGGGGNEDDDDDDDDARHNFRVIHSLSVVKKTHFYGYHRRPNLFLQCEYVHVTTFFMRSRHNV